MRRIILATLVLWHFFCAPRGSEGPLPGAHTWCHDPSGACYSVHLARRTFQRAQNACAEHGGGLSTASGTTEVRAILALLGGVGNGSGASLFWLGLVRKAQQCTREDLPLRGFSWAPLGFQEATRNETTRGTPRWVREPTKSCTMERCAGLQVTLGQPALEPWGLSEQACARASPGYICKYSRARACLAPHPPSGAPSLRYTLPYGLQSTAAEFSPPGTALTLRCPAGREARFICRLSPDGYHWEGTEDRLCSCPSGYWSPSQGACVERPGCAGARGAFLCLCAWGSQLVADEKSCEDGRLASTARPDLPTAPAASGAFLPNSTGRPGPNSSLEEPFPSGTGNDSAAGADEKPLAAPDSSNYVFILITVAVVVLVILIMAALQVFQVCFRMCSSSKGSRRRNHDGAAAEAAKDDAEASATRTDSEHSLGPSKAESVEAPQGDAEPVDGQGELE